MSVHRAGGSGLRDGALHPPIRGASCTGRTRARRLDGLSFFGPVPRKRGQAFTLHFGPLSFAKKPFEGNDGGLIDGYDKNAMCSRRPPQQGRQAAESRSVAGDAGTFRRTGQERIDWGSIPISAPSPVMKIGYSSSPARRMTNDASP